MFFQEEEKENRFGVPSIGIPAEVLFHPDLTSTERLLFGLIRNLAQSNQGCYASNNYLGAFLQTGKQTITNGIANLKKHKFIIVKMETGGNNRTIRRVFINPDYPNIYRKMVAEIHDILTGKNDLTSIKKFMEEGIKKFIGGHKKISSKDVNKDVILPKGKTLAFLQNAVQEKIENRTRIRKTSAPTNSEKSGKVKYKSKTTSELIKFWNSQPLLKGKHKEPTNNKPPTKVYKKCTEFLHRMINGTLHKIVSEDSLSDGVDYEWFSKQWQIIEVKKAIQILNDMCKEGNLPVDKKWINKLSLHKAIFNPRTGTSALMKAFHVGIQPVYQPLQSLNTPEQKRAYTILQTFFKDYLKKDNTNTHKQIVVLVQSLTGLREKNKRMWDLIDKKEVRENPEKKNMASSGTVASLVELYVDFLKGGREWTTKFVVKDMLTPNGLRYRGYIWNKFKQACFDSFNMHPITGKTEKASKLDSEVTDIGKQKSFPGKKPLYKETEDKEKKQLKIKEQIRLERISDLL